MNKQSISFKADEQKLTKTGGIEHYASNIVAYIEATFDLGTNWNGYDSVRAVWSNDYLTDISTVLDSNGKCIVPTEVLTDTGNVTVNLVGSIADGDTLTDRLTTYPCKAVIVDADAKVEGDETESITPSQFEQFVEIVHDEVEQVTGMTAEAETLPAGSDATASYSDGVLSLGIPKGEQGEQGEQGETGHTGEPAGFGDVTASVDNTVGTPSVVVNTSGPDTAKEFDFEFHNLKGEQGEQGEQGDPGVVQDVQVNGTSVVDQNGVAKILMPELIKTVNGNPIVIDDAFGEVKNLDVELLPIQAGTGTPSPQNVRPITGHDSVDVTVTDGDSQSQSKTVTLPHTVYGAGVGVTSGEGTEKYGIVDLGTLTYTYYPNYQRFDYDRDIGIKKPSSNSTPANVICTIYSTIDANSITSHDSVVAVNTSGYLRIRDTRYTDATAFKQAMSGVYLCYELADYTDLSTTPTDITLYNGDNVISSDGDIDLSYVQDMATVIRKVENQL